MTQTDPGFVPAWAPCPDCDTGGRCTYVCGWRPSPAPEADIVARLMTDANEIEACGGGNEAATMREAAAEIERLRAERAPDGWRDALRECADDLAEWVEDRYRDTKNYPGEARRYERDIAPVRRARAMLDAAPEPPAPAEAPGHTDLMVSPESLDEWLKDNPPPASPAEATDPYLLLLGDQTAVKIGGTRFDGWLFRKHPGGQWISVRKLEREDLE